MWPPSSSVPSSHVTVVAVALCVVALTSACGSDEPPAVGMTAAQLEKHVVQHYQPEDADATTPYSAACEGSIDAAVDATQDCLVTTPEQEVGVRVQVTDAEADDLGLQTTPFIPAESVAESIAGSLEIQGYTQVEAVCDGDLVGEVGRKVVCTMSMPEGESEVNVEVTSIDALQINFEFKSA
jgi:Domain of unknown function (DUF4333)